MSSDNGSKYLTPCRTVGLRRIHRKTPSKPVSSGSGAAKSVNSPFTSPLIAGARTACCTEKKRSPSLNSLWSSPLISKTGFKVGLAKLSGKQKTQNQGCSTPSSGDIHSTASGDSPKRLDGGSTPCTPIGVHVGGPESKPSKCHSGDSPEPLQKKKCNIGVEPKSLLVSSAKNTLESLCVTPNNPLEKCPSVEITPISIVSKCVNSNNASLENAYVDTDGKMFTSDVITPSLSPESSVKPVKNGFCGWDLESEESVSSQSRLYIFKSFLENQMIKSTKAINPSSRKSRVDSSESESATEDEDACSESSNESYLGQGVTDNLNAKNMGSLREYKLNAAKGTVCESGSAQDVSNKTSTPIVLKDRGELCASQGSMSFDSEEDETDDKWDFASSRHSRRGTYSVREKANGKLSLKRQPSPLISKRQEANSICARASTFVQTVNDQESSGRADAKLEERSLCVGSSAEEFEKIKMDIRKWLEGGQRAIREIVEEVRLQKDREMSVMEVLAEQGVDPDLVGYDPKQEEFITFDKFIMKNGIS